MPCTGGPQADWYRAGALSIYLIISTKFYYVYILRSLKDRLFYCGYSDNLKQRVYEHNMGKNTSTKNRRPLELIFYEAYRNKADALRRETYFKTTKGKVTLKQMLKEFLK